MSHPTRSEITPEWVYLNRRKFMRAAGISAAGVAAAGLAAACGVKTGANGGRPDEAMPTAEAAIPAATSVAPFAVPEPTGQTAAGADADELGNALTPYESVIGFNNYYEFSLNQLRVAQYTDAFQPEPWEVEVGGLVDRPMTYQIEDLRALGQEERIYRMRCVEAWAMVIPWIGFPLRRLLEQVQPQASAKFVEFQTALRPEQMPNQKSGGFEWPYIEGLRLDEAMHDLTIMATGLYGKDLLAQNGAPIRLVVPWKYGFKSIKSVVRITLVEEMPATFWADYNPREYGFYANVNPNVDHPRWSQATERRIGESGRRETLMFNGYEDEVADLYGGMDLNVYI